MVGDIAIGSDYPVRVQSMINEDTMDVENAFLACLLYTSDAADEHGCVDLGGRRIIKKKFFKAEDGIRDSS